MIFLKAEFEVMEKSTNLLAFALTHCEAGSIEEIIQSLLRLEQRSLNHSLQLRAEVAICKNGGDTEEEIELFEDSFEDVR